MNIANNQAGVADRAKARPNRVWIAVILGILSGIGPIVIDLYLPGLQIYIRLRPSSSLA
ncbi:Bcr/CflA subfamily drug resistance transporter [Bacillus glycinifermentans]|nr:Bcr/CflA subfamily drug resistance transporter [Bacillus glycinifermentans]